MLKLSIADVAYTDDGTFMDIRAIVSDMSPPHPVSTDIIQEIKLADKSGSIMLTLWDTSTSLLKLSVAYDFSRLLVDEIQFLYDCTVIGIQSHDSLLVCKLFSMPYRRNRRPNQMQEF